MSDRGQMITFELLSSEEENAVHTGERLFGRIGNLAVAHMLTALFTVVVAFVCFAFLFDQKVIPFFRVGEPLQPLAALGFVVVPVSLGAIIGWLSRVFYFKRRQARKVAELLNWATDPRTRPALLKLEQMQPAVAQLIKFKSVLQQLKHPPAAVASRVRTFFPLTA